MTKSLRFKPSAAFKVPITLLKLLGFWIHEGPFRLLYLFYGKTIYLSITVLYAASMFMHILKVWGDIAEMLDGMYLFVTVTCIIFKLGFLDNNKMKNVIEMLDSEELNSQTKEQDFFIQRAMYVTKRNSSAFCLVCTFVCWSLYLLPFLTGTFYLKQLPLKAWFPFPYEETPYYELAYLYQAVGIWFGALVNCSVDGIVAGLMIMASGQLQVLKDSLRNLRRRALTQLNRLTEDDRCDTCHNGPLHWKCDDPAHFTKGDADLEEETYQQMIKCIRHHQVIIEYVRKIEVTYTKSMFAQFLSSMLVICITAFQISVIKPFTMFFFTILVYMVNMVTQLFFYCWYGNELHWMSLTINEDVYNSDWYRFGPRVRKLMIIMMERSKRPMIITAGKMFHLSLDTFTSIMKSAYSFYAVLNQMEIDINFDNLE